MTQALVILLLLSQSTFLLAMRSELDPIGYRSPQQEKLKQIIELANDLHFAIYEDSLYHEMIDNPHDNLRVKINEYSYQLIEAITEIINSKPNRKDAYTFLQKSVDTLPSLSLVYRSQPFYSAKREHIICDETDFYKEKLKELIDDYECLMIQKK